MNSSSAWAITSTSALPTPTTSNSNAPTRRVQDTRPREPRCRVRSVVRERQPVPPSTNRRPEPLHADARARSRRGVVRRAPCRSTSTSIETVELDRAQRRRAGHRVRVASTAPRPPFDSTRPTERLIIDAPLTPGDTVDRHQLHRHAQRQAARLVPQHVPATPTAPSRSSPRRRCRPPTAAGRSRAGTSPTSRRCSTSRSSSSPTCSPCPTAPRSDAIERDDGKHVVHFSETMPMSTYLVAFVVGPLEATEPVDAVRRRPSRCAIVHVPGKGHLTDVRPRGRRARRCAGTRTTTASPTPPTSATCSPCPTSPPGRWRTSAASPTARTCCSPTRPPRRRPSSRSSPTSSPTSWPTCGSATW